MIRNVFQNLVKIVRHFRAYRWHFALVFLLALVYSLLAGVGIAAFIPLFKLSRADAQENYSRIGRVFHSAFQYVGLEPSLISIFLLVVGFLLLRFLMFTGYQLIIQYSISDYKKTTVNNLTRKLFSTRWEYFQNQHRGSLLDYMTTRIVRVRNLMRISTKILVSYTVAFGYLITAFWISSTLTIMAIVMTIVTISVMIPLAGKTKQISRTSMQSQNQISRFLDEFMNAFREIKIYNTFDDVQEKVEEQTQDNARAEFKVGLLKNLSREAFLVLIGMVLLGGIYYTLAETQVSLEQLGPFGLLFLLIFQRLNKLDKIQRIAEFSPSINVLENLSSELDRNAEEIDPQGVNNPATTFTFQNQIEFKDVSFSYGPGRSPDADEALSGVSLTIPRGTMSAFVGRSGAGKSTLMGLLLGILTPTSGEIRVDDLSMHEIGLEKWRSNISYVPQEPFLLNDTIRENIRFFRSISDDALVSAARKSNAHEFIRNTSDGYDTVIGEEGVKLSGGQRQRLVFARAIAGNPEVLILDEPTSELDAISEEHIRYSLNELQENMTIISVSHQLGTVVDADCIYVLEDGHVVERGTQQQLEELQGRFCELQNAS